MIEPRTWFNENGAKLCDRWRDEDDATTRERLEAMSLRDLRALAKRRGLKQPFGATAAQLVEIILAAATQDA